MKRRAFIKTSLKGMAGLPLVSLAVPLVSSKVGARSLEKSDVVKPFEARYYEKLGPKKVKCVLCPRECQVVDLERGYCGVRENRKGVYYSLVYARPCSLAVDPVEKKPLFHFRPGTTAYSLATAGCNVECKFCQNWNISQMRPEQVKSVYMSPSKVVDEALLYGSKSVAFTYTEPVVFQEYLVDTAIEGKKRGIPVVMITNGYIKKKPLEEVCKHVPAIKVDLKAFTERFYKKYVNGALKPVLDALLQIKKSGTWLELVVLIIPGLNDSVTEIEQMTKWVKKSLGKSVPIHFTRFHPMYKMKNIPSTPVATLERCRQIGMKNGLDFVYIGNVPGHPGEHTYCPNPKCKGIVIERFGFWIKKSGLKNGACAKCGTKISGIWS